MPKVTCTIDMPLSGAQFEKYKDVVILLLKKDYKLDPLDTLNLKYSIHEELSNTNSLIENLAGILAVCADDEVPVKFDMFALEMVLADTIGMAEQMAKLIKVLKGRQNA